MKSGRNGKSLLCSSINAQVGLTGLAFVNSDGTPVASTPGGSTVGLKVTLSGPAREGGAVVSLIATVGSPAAATVPSSATVAANSTTTTVNIPTVKRTNTFTLSGHAGNLRVYSISCFVMTVIRLALTRSFSYRGPVLLSESFGPVRRETVPFSLAMSPKRRLSILPRVANSTMTNRGCLLSC